MEASRRSLELILRSQLPNPALAFDRRYDRVTVNPAVRILLEGVEPELLQESVNVLRVSPWPR